MFATVTDVLARTNAVRLCQLCVPADFAMPSVDNFRLFLEDGDTSAIDADELVVLASAATAINDALSDATALMVSYGLPENAESSLLARMCSTIALYYLQSAECMTDELQKMYDGVIKMLHQHAAGAVRLLPTLPLPNDDSTCVVIESAPSRYGGYDANGSLGFETP